MTTQPNPASKPLLFITGATGYNGLRLTRHTLESGYSVHGLSRTPSGDAALQALGATPIRGSVTTLSVLTEESRLADAVLHLAFIHDWSMDYNEVLRIDAAAVSAIGDALQGTDKPFVVTSGTAVVRPDPNGGETSEMAEIAVPAVLERIKAERHALTLVERGVRVSVVRLPPFVYGYGGQGFLSWLMQTALKNGEALYIGDGSVRTACVFVDDAASIFLLAVRKAGNGDVFNCAADTTVTAKQMAEAIGEVCDLPVRSVDGKEAEEKLGPLLTKVLMLENRPSSRKAREVLGWEPVGVGLLEDVREGSYREVARKLKKAK